MTRPLRLEYPGALWHVTNRGVEQRAIFLDNNDRYRFLEILAEAVPRFRWRLYAWVLMRNHFHLLVETVEPTLSRGMQRIDCEYAEAFNWRHRRVGHLFQGRFKSHLIDSESYLLEVARYIVLNPVRAKIVATPEEWDWSSYPATAGLRSIPSWLSVEAILDRFDRRNRGVAINDYRHFVHERFADQRSPWNGLAGQIYLGSAAFIQRVQERIDERTRSVEHVRAQRIVRCTTVDEVERAIVETTGATPGRLAATRIRLAFALLARSEALAPLRTIAAKLGVGLSGANYLVRKADRLRKTDRQFADLIDQIVASTGHCKLQI
jgi:putative transposase